jgi:hypothetical protein
MPSISAIQTGATAPAEGPPKADRRTGRSLSSMSQPSSAAFWSLIDRWRVSDEQALELISYEGKLPTTGRRPRFRLSDEQARIVATLLEVDSALATAGIDPVWLQRRSDKMPRTPLDLMRAGAIDEVLRSLTHATLQASIAQAKKA